MRSLDPENLNLKDDRWLVFQDAANNGHFEGPVPLPFGNKIDLERDDLLIDPQDDEVYVGRKDSDLVRVFPPYKSTEVIQHPGIDEEIPLEVRAINVDAERRIALSVIGRTHYLSPPRSGYIIGCSFVYAEHEKKLIELASEKRPEDKTIESPVWTQPKGRIIGAAVVSEMYYGVPKGRKHFADSVFGEGWIEKLREDEQRINEEERPPKPDELTRQKVVRELDLAWGSRFAVEKPFQGIGSSDGRGVGDVLAGELAKVAFGYRVPPAERIEVMRTITKQEGRNLLKGQKEDFLTREGYRPLEMTSSPPLSDPEEGAEGQYPPPKPWPERDTVYKKLYYLLENES